MGCSMNQLASILPLHTTSFSPFPIQKFIVQGGDQMKKIAVELFVIAATVMVYVAPVFAWAGGW